MVARVMSTAMGSDGWHWGIRVEIAAERDGSRCGDRSITTRPNRPVRRFADTSPRLESCHDWLVSVVIVDFRRRLSGVLRKPVNGCVCRNGPDVSYLSRFRPKRLMNIRPNRHILVRMTIPYRLRPCFQWSFLFAENPKDTTAGEVAKVTFRPAAKTFEEDIMDSMGIKETRKSRVFWYYVLTVSG